MMTNELLEAKYRAQRQLNKQAGHDLRTYAKNVHQVVQATEKKHGLKFRYKQVRKKVVSSANVAHESAGSQTLIGPEVTAGA
jgi:hypothetical protein